MAIVNRRIPILNASVSILGSSELDDAPIASEAPIGRTERKPEGSPMSTSAWPSRERILDEVRSRLAFESRPATEYLVTIIVLWYLFQTAVLALGWNTELVLWVFTTESFPALSPGLFFAIISHAFFPNLSHFLGNVTLLWLVAGESEQHMNSLEVGGFFIGTALTAVLVGTAVSGGNTLGASGGGLAFLAFYCSHILLEHRNEMEFETIKEPGLTDTSFRAYVGVCLILTLILLIPYMVGQHAGLIPAGRADVVGHLTGFLCGIGYAVIRSTVYLDCTE
jgi:membrane associated rhomboid family serine protease